MSRSARLRSQGDASRASSHVDQQHTLRRDGALVVAPLRYRVVRNGGVAALDSQHQGVKLLVGGADKAARVVDDEGATHGLGVAGLARLRCLLSRALTCD